MVVDWFGGRMLPSPFLNVSVRSGVGTVSYFSMCLLHVVVHMDLSMSVDRVEGVHDLIGTVFDLSLQGAQCRVLM